MAQTVQGLPTVRETQVQSLGWEDLLEKKWQPTPVFLPGEFHGQRSLVGYSSCYRSAKEWDTTERLTLRLFSDLKAKGKENRLNSFERRSREEVVTNLHYYDTVCCLLSPNRNRC